LSFLFLKGHIFIFSYRSHAYIFSRNHIPAAAFTFFTDSGHDILEIQSYELVRLYLYDFL